MLSLMSASIFVFITLIVSSQARHVNTWWAQTLVQTIVCLFASGIFYKVVLCYCLQSATETLSCFFHLQDQGQ